jgi:1,3-beta-glucan synthase component
MTTQGAAEQSLSRDTARLGARLDFMRLWSFYFGGLGYYIGHFVTVVTIVFVVYFMLAQAVSGRAAATLCRACSRAQCRQH